MFSAFFAFELKTEYWGVCLAYLRFRLAALCEGTVLHPLPLYYGTIVAVRLWGMSSFDVCH